MNKIWVFILIGWLNMNSDMSAETVENGYLNEKSDKKLNAPSCRANESDFYISRGKRLLEWNKEKLTSRSNLRVNDIKELFAPEFVVMANGRKYHANAQNYYEFLNKFRADIDTIDYEVQEYLNAGSTVVMPLKATVKRVEGKVDIYNAIMLIKYNDLGKIVHWQEVYSIEGLTK